MDHHLFVSPGLGGWEPPRCLGTQQCILHPPLPVSRHLSLKRQVKSDSTKMIRKRDGDE